MRIKSSTSGWSRVYRPALRMALGTAIAVFAAIKFGWLLPRAATPDMVGNVIWFSLAEQREPVPVLEPTVELAMALQHKPERVAPTPPRASAKAVHLSGTTTHVDLGAGGSVLQAVRIPVLEDIVPNPRALRTEELINHFRYADYPLPQDAEPFALSARLVPNPWCAGTDLLHVAVQGRPIGKIGDRAPITLILMIDVAAWAMDAGRLGVVARSVRDLLPLMGPEDRIAVLDYRSTRWPDRGAQDGPLLAPVAATDRDRVMRSLWRLTNSFYTPNDGGEISQLREWTEKESRDGRRVIAQLLGSTEHWPDGPGWARALRGCCPLAERFDWHTDLSLGHGELTARMAAGIGVAVPELGRGMRISVRTAGNTPASPMGYGIAGDLPAPDAIMRASEQFTALFLLPRGEAVRDIALSWTDPSMGTLRTLVLKAADIAVHRRLIGVPASTALSVGLLGYSDFLAERQPGITWPAVRHLLVQGSKGIVAGDDRALLLELAGRTETLPQLGLKARGTLSNWAQ